MPINVHAEEILSLQAAAKLPCFSNRRGGRPINVATLYRWATGPGCRGHRLETVMAGGTRVTSEEAILRFFEALTVEAAPGPAAPPPPLSRHRQAQIAIARRRRDRLPRRHAGSLHRQSQASKEATP